MNQKLKNEIMNAAIIRFDDENDCMHAWYGVDTTRVYVFDMEGKEFHVYTLGNIDVNMNPYDPTSFEKVVEAMGRYIIGESEYP